MKSSTVISALLLLNLGLVLLVGYLLRTRPVPEPAPMPAAARLVTNEPKVIIRGAAPRIITVTNDFQWAQLESEDYRDYILRLRAIGCPEQTIRDIIIADLDKLFSPRVQSIYGRRENLQYWQSEEEELANDQDPRKWQQEEQAIDNEKRGILLELLGVDLVRERMKQKGVADYYERRLGFLPEDKRTAVRLVLEDYDTRESTMRAGADAGGEPLTPTEREQLAQWRTERDSELARLLTAEERRQLDLWISPTANAVRYAFYGMDATEKEFLSVYNLRKSFDEQWNPDTIDLADDTQLAAWARAKQELDQRLKETLGAERFRQYQRGQDGDWHRLNATVTRFELPREYAAEAYGMKETLQTMQDYVSQDPHLTPDQKATALGEMKRETQKAVQQMLGRDGYQYFTSGGHGQWLR